MSMFKPTPFRLTPAEKLQTLVEHKTSFNLNHCQLNIYETHERVSDFKLDFQGVAITAMLRGRKVMHVPKHEDFNYLPGETVIVPAGTRIAIDFPDAERTTPTQCTAIELDYGYFQRQIDYINEQLQSDNIISVDYRKILIRNSEQLTSTLNRLHKIMSSDDIFKDAQADLIMKELILSLVRAQNLHALHHNGRYESSPFKMILEYIRSNIASNIEVNDLCKVACMSKSAFYRAFTQEFGVSPNQLILQERLRISKAMMVLDNISVKDTCYAVGFDDPNYFIRLFKKHEGITPGQFIKSAQE